MFGITCKYVIIIRKQDGNRYTRLAIHCQRAVTNLRMLRLPPAMAPPDSEGMSSFRFGLRGSIMPRYLFERLQNTSFCRFEYSIYYQMISGHFSCSFYRTSVSSRNI